MDRHGCITVLYKTAPRRGESAGPDLAFGVDLDLISLVGGETLEIGYVELGENVPALDLGQSRVERHLAVVQGVGIVVAVDSSQELLRGQSMVPVNDDDRGVIRATEGAERRETRQEPGAAGLSGEKPLLPDSRVHENFFGERGDSDQGGLHDRRAQHTSGRQVLPIAQSSPLTCTRRILAPRRRSFFSMAS